MQFHCRFSRSISPQPWRSIQFDVRGADKHEVAGIWAVLYSNSADNILDRHKMDTFDARIDQYCSNFGKNA